MPHGLTEADYKAALDQARQDENEELVAVLQTAEEIVSLLEFAHLGSLAGLKKAVAQAQEKVVFLENHLLA